MLRGTNLIKKTIVDISVDKLSEHSIRIKFSPERSDIFNPIFRYRRNESNRTRNNARYKGGIQFTIFSTIIRCFSRSIRCVNKTVGLLSLYQWSSILLFRLQPKLYRLQLLRSLAYMSILVVVVRCK